MADGIRVGIIGLASAYAALYAEALAEMDAANLVAVCSLGRDDQFLHQALAGLPPDRYPTTVSGFAERYGVDVQDDPGEFFDEGALDAVVICTEDALRVRPAVQALSRGIHVYVPKPFATSLEEAMLLFQASREGRAFITPSLPLRHHPAYRAAKEIVDSARLGDVLAAHLTLAHHLELGSWRSDPSLASGPELSAAFDVFDALLWLAGDGPTSLTAYAANLEHRGVPFIDTAKTLLRLGRGGLVSADFLLGPHYRFPTLELSLVGTEAGLQIQRRGDRGGMVLRLFDRHGETEQLITPGPLYRAEMETWLSLLQEHDQGANDALLQGAVMALQVCLAFRQSWQGQQAVSLPLPLPQPPAPQPSAEGEASEGELGDAADADDTIL